MARRLGDRPRCAPAAAATTGITDRTLTAGGAWNPAAAAAKGLVGATPPLAAAAEAADGGGGDGRPHWCLYSDGAEEEQDAPARCFFGRDATAAAAAFPSPQSSRGFSAASTLATTTCSCSSPPPPPPPPDSLRASGTAPNHEHVSSSMTRSNQTMAII
uniref:Uncharacterized protein n=1 Tax=Oryza punctata TaxID=4537 RepID=A0A0E0M358_ORYPU